MTSAIRVETSRMAPAFRVLCLALRHAQGTAGAEQLRAAIPADTDWSSVIEGARRHRVAPLVLAGLQTAAVTVVPEPALDELRRQAVAAARRSLLQAAEIARLLQLLDAAGIRAFTLKGTALSVQLYQSPGMRDPRDIDMLVDPTRFEDAEAVLEQAGYRSSLPALSPRQRCAYHQWFKEVQHVGPRSVAVELHHRFTDDPALLPCDFETLWHERETVRLGGIEAPVLPQHMLALYLCVHGAEHTWRRMCWLADMAALLRPPGAADDALAAADRAGLAAPMRHAALLAHEWLGLPLDAATAADLRADRRVARMGRLLTPSCGGAEWSEPAPASNGARLRQSLRQRRYRWSMKAGWRHRLHRLRHEMVAPGDWVAWPLPDYLFWLYPMLRPFGWLLRRVPARPSISEPKSPSIRAATAGTEKPRAV